MKNFFKGAIGVCVVVLCLTFASCSNEDVTTPDTREGFVIKSAEDTGFTFDYSGAEPTIIVDSTTSPVTVSDVICHTAWNKSRGAAVVMLDSGAFMLVEWSDNVTDFPKGSNPTKHIAPNGSTRYMVASGLSIAKADIWCSGIQ